LANAVQRAKPNDLVLLLDWREAANTSANAFQGILAKDNQNAASWISSVADFAYNQLKSWGVTNGEKINFIGHSLGSLVSGEIASRFGTVNTITALEPPSDGNLTVNFGNISIPIGYDLNYQKFGIQGPPDFRNVSNFARAFLGW
jgi:pimeloyl-ACP methyl ester carboxylesterase